VGYNVPVDSETLLVTDFVNLKIKSAQFFKYAHRSKVCVRVFIGVSVHMRMSICVCIVFLKKMTLSAVTEMMSILTCSYMVTLLIRNQMHE
jgi:hypothetical protein